MLPPLHSGTGGGGETYDDEVTLDGSISRLRGLISDKAFKGVVKLHREVEFHRTRLATARAALKRLAHGGDRESLLDAQDELRCAREDMVFHERLMRQAILDAMPWLKDRDAESTEKLIEQEEQRCRAMPHEIARKKRMEEELGYEIDWPDYWRMLDKMYAEQEQVAGERSAECYRSYGWDFDSGDGSGVYPSDKGMQYTNDEEGTRVLPVKVADDTHKMVKFAAKREPRKWDPNKVPKKERHERQND